MDWYVPAGADGAVGELRTEIRGYLERHAEHDADLHGAEIVASELIQNGLTHTGGPVWVSLEWSGAHPILTVSDLGEGFELDPSLPADPLSPGGRGLYIVSQLGKALERQHRRSGGNRVRATLPVTRPQVVSHDPPRRSSTLALPALDEALPSGGFGKESFLRALVVQLAQTVERDHGPDAAEAAVAQVGADVGGQMEAEYRAVSAIVERLDPEQMAECYVRLKAAIDGEFRVESIDARRIVLVNSRCPFGEAVVRAPALCRMTSSVFGGIAARNTDRGAIVVLEERIAIGDPGCRVVVWLDPEAEDVTHGHRYASPPSD